MRNLNKILHTSENLKVESRISVMDPCLRALFMVEAQPWLNLVVEVFDHFRNLSLEIFRSGHSHLDGRDD